MGVFFVLGCVVKERVEQRRPQLVQPDGVAAAGAIQPIADPHAMAVNCSNLDHLMPFGSVRIEDRVNCTEAAPESLARDAFSEPISVDEAARKTG